MPEQCALDLLIGFADAEIFGNRNLGLALLAAAGLAAGVINSIAGGGSFLTLPVLTALGLPPSLANGTMRVGIIPQNLAIVGTFMRQGVRVPKSVWVLVLPMCLGAGGGSYLATQIDDAVLQPLFGAIFVLWAVILIVKPGSFAANDDEPRDAVPLTWLFAALIGVYGGFMQAGVGFPLLAMLVGHMRFDPVRANAAKAALVLSYTVVALAVFATAGKVAWAEAGILTLGTMTGGWLGTRVQLKAGAGMVRWFVVAMVVISGGVMLWRSLS